MHKIIGDTHCQFVNNSRNVGSISVSQGPGGFVNDPCNRGQVGPLRDCEFTPPGPVQSCAAGSTVTLKCKTGGSKQVLRVCEASQALATGIPCTYLNSASNSIIDGDSETVSFSCPAVGDATSASSGGYSLSHAPLLPDGTPDAVACR